MTSEKFWEFAERTAQEIEQQWPEWKKKAVGYPIKESKMETSNEEKIKALQEYISEMGKMLSVNWNGNSTDKVVQSALSETLEEIEYLRNELKIWKKDHKLMIQKIITCGVAADHPDPNLTLRDDYMKWNSPQAERVRGLRKRADESIKEIERLKGELRNAMQIIEQAAPRFASYDECMEGQDQGLECNVLDDDEHELRYQMDDFIERNKVN